VRFTLTTSLRESGAQELENRQTLQQAGVGIVGQLCRPSWCAQTVAGHAPALNAVIPVVAGFGGVLGRKGDGEPGAKTLCIGPSVSWTSL